MQPRPGEGADFLAPGRFCVRIYQFDASVAQLDRASDFGSEGCRFKSYRTRHFESLCNSDMKSTSVKGR